MCGLVWCHPLKLTACWKELFSMLFQFGSYTASFQPECFTSQICALLWLNSFLMEPLTRKRFACLTERVYKQEISRLFRQLCRSPVFQSTSSLGVFNTKKNDALSMYVSAGYKLLKTAPDFLPQWCRPDRFWLCHHCVFLVFLRKVLSRSAFKVWSTCWTLRRKQIGGSTQLLWKNKTLWKH